MYFGFKDLLTEVIYLYLDLVPKGGKKDHLQAVPLSWSLLHQFPRSEAGSADATSLVWLRSARLPQLLSSFQPASVSPSVFLCPLHLKKAAALYLFEAEGSFIYPVTNPRLVCLNLCAVCGNCLFLPDAFPFPRKVYFYLSLYVCSVRGGLDRCQSFARPFAICK